MQIILFLGKSKSIITDGVIAIGVFDGMHRGHAALLDKAVSETRKLKARCTAVTFWPHPAKTPVICSLRKRLNLIAERGVDYCVVVPFTKRFSRIPPRKFIKDIIVKKFSPRYLFVGSNFTFGRGASGDVRLLKRFSDDFGFFLKEVKIVKVAGIAVSSTVIRDLVAKGRLFLVSKLLGRDFTIEGKVIGSQGLGRHLGYPTANIDYDNEILPPDGVYVSEITVKDNAYKGLCYIGRRPTIRQTEKRSVEVFILNFNKHIYGKLVELKPISFIRKDKKFNTLKQLSSQISRDIATAKQIFRKRK